MHLLDKKIFREIRIYKFRSILILGVVAISLALLTGMRASQPMLMATYKENLIQTNVADGRFTFTSPIIENNISAIENNETFMNEYKILDIEGRIILYTDIKYNGEKFPAIIIGINYPNKVNKLYIEQKADDIQNESDLLNDPTNCIIETRFAGDFLGQSMTLNDNISLIFGGNVEYNFTMKGVAEDPDFLYVVDPTNGMTLMGQMAVVWININVLQNVLFAGAPMINQILYTVEPRLNKDVIEKASEAFLLKLAENNVDISGAQFTIYDETPDKKFFDADAGSVDKVGTIFGVIGLVICAVIIFNTLNRMVQSQNKNIGLFLAMGSPRKKIIAHYMKITLVLSIFGIIIGIPLGYMMSLGMLKAVTSVYSIHYFDFSINYIEFLYGGLIMLATSLLFSGISAYPITKITPRDAMTSVFNRIRATKRTIFEKLFGWLPMFKSIYMTIPLREIFLRKKRSFFTILALTTSMIILINSVAMTYNMFDQINKNFTDYNTADINIVFDQPIPISELHSKMNASSENGIEYYELYIDLFTKLNYNGEFLTWTELQCYQANSTLRYYNIINGESDPQKLDSSHIFIGNSIAGKYDLGINDNVSIGLIENQSVVIIGEVGELIDYNIIWTIEAFNSDNSSLAFGIPTNYVNGLLIRLANNANIQKVRDFIEDNFQVAKWTDKETNKKAITNLMNSMFSMLLMFILVGVGIGISFSHSSMYLAFIDREDDFIALRAMGAELKTIKKGIFWENLFLSFFGLLFTIPIGTFVYRASMNYMMGDKFYFSLEIPPFTWGLIFLLSIFSIWLATGKLMKKIKKLNLANELRQRIIS